MRRAATWSRWCMPAVTTASLLQLRHPGVTGSSHGMWLTTARAASGGATSDAPRNKKSLLVDGNNVLYHYYNPLLPANSDGVQREAIDGLIQLLKRMNKTHRPAHICVFFDSKRKPTVRKLIDPTYKSQRKPTPQSLGPQLASAAEILAEGGVNCITYPGFEADDLVASYTEAYVTAGYDVLVVSNDNDFLQLARGTSALDGAAPATTTPTQPIASAGGSEQGEPLRNDAETRTPSSVVELYQPNKRRYIRERHLQSRFGLPHARLIPDFLALIGTRWGKIKKVDHMTEERAVELLTEYGSLPKLLRNLNSIEDPMLRKSLKHAISSIETSLRIAKLNDEIVLPIPLADLQAPQLDKLQIASASVAATAKRKSGAIRGKRVKDAN